MVLRDRPFSSYIRESRGGFGNNLIVLAITLQDLGISLPVAAFARFGSSLSVASASTFSSVNLDMEIGSSLSIASAGISGEALSAFGTRPLGKSRRTSRSPAAASALQ